MLRNDCLIASPLCFSDAAVVMDGLTSDRHGIDRHERETDIDECVCIDEESIGYHIHAQGEAWAIHA